MDFQHLLADRTRKMGASAIREILKVVSQPGMISLAGGIPAPESFPMDIMEQLTSEVIAKYASRAFQYDFTEGFPPLREALAPYLRAKGVEAAPEEILVASGSQGVLDAVGKVLISKGDKIAVEAPTYLGALQAFTPYEPTYVRMDTDADGLIPESLEAVLKEHCVKLIYLVPTFQNPTGRTIPLARRRQIAEIIQKYNAFLIEDDPYSPLRYRGEAVPPIKRFAPDHVLYITTLSKVFAPGLRLGICVAPPLIQHWIVVVKQGVDLHTSTFNQALAAEYLTQGYIDQQLPKIVRLYGPKLAAMLKAMDAHFPADFTWSRPEGGMFIWAEGPAGLDIEPLYWKGIEQKVAFVPGRFFYTQEGEGLATMRLNFTMCTEPVITQAIEILGGVLKASR